MTGDEHYQSAEAWLLQAENGHHQIWSPIYASQAQVHATLALAAATHYAAIVARGDWRDEGVAP